MKFWYLRYFKWINSKALHPFYIWLIESHLSIQIINVINVISDDNVNQTFDTKKHQAVINISKLLNVTLKSSPWNTTSQTWDKSYSSEETQMPERQVHLEHIFIQRIEMTIVRESGTRWMLDNPVWYIR